MQGKQAGQRRGAAQPPHQGNSRAPALYKGAHYTPQKQMPESPALDTEPQRPLRLQCQCAEHSLISITWEQIGPCLPEDRPVSPNPSTQQTGSSGPESERSGRCSAAPHWLQGVGCLLPGNKLSTRLPLWEVPPPPPPQAGDEAEEIMYSSLLPPPTSHPTPTCSH